MNAYELLKALSVARGWKIQSAKFDSASNSSNSVPWPSSGGSVYLVEWAAKDEAGNSVSAPTAEDIDSVSQSPIPLPRPENQVGAQFPQNPYDGMRFTRIDLEYSDWIWNTQSSEWWSAMEWVDGAGYNGGVSNDTPFRRFNGMSLSGNQGIPVVDRIRLRRIEGQIGNPGAGELLISLNGNVQGRRLRVLGESSFSAPCPAEDKWLIGNLGDSQSLSVSWVGDSINNPQIRLIGRYVRLMQE